MTTSAHAEEPRATRAGPREKLSGDVAEPLIGKLCDSIVVTSTVDAFTAKQYQDTRRHQCRWELSRMTFSVDRAAMPACEKILAEPTLVDPSEALHTRACQAAIELATAEGDWCSVIYGCGTEFTCSTDMHCVPKRKLGEACENDLQCGSIATCHDVCTAPAGPGASCAGPVHCEPGLSCVNDHCTANKGKLGDRCRGIEDCIHGLQCDGDNHCHDGVAPGAACHIGAECQSGESKHNSSGQCTCL